MVGSRLMMRSRRERAVSEIRPGLVGEGVKFVGEFAEGGTPGLVFGGDAGSVGGADGGGTVGAVVDGGRQIGNEWDFN